MTSSKIDILSAFSTPWSRTKCASSVFIFDCTGNGSGKRMSAASSIRSSVRRRPPKLRKSLAKWTLHFSFCLLPQAFTVLLRIRLRTARPPPSQNQHPMKPPSSHLRKLHSG